jgi:hypothetical protein
MLICVYVHVYVYIHIYTYYSTDNPANIGDTSLLKVEELRWHLGEGGHKVNVTYENVQMLKCL